MATTYDSVIEQIAQSIFATMLDMELVRVDHAGSADYPALRDEEQSLLAAVQIAGQWMGSVVLSLSPSLAQAAAAAMLQMPLDEVTASDQQDVAAELTNMIGGNLKSLLPSPSFLSLPTIISGRQVGLEVHDAELIDRVALDSPFGTLDVRLYAQTPEDPNESATN